MQHLGFPCVLLRSSPRKTPQKNPRKKPWQGVCFMIILLPITNLILHVRWKRKWCDIEMINIIDQHKCWNPHGFVAIFCAGEGEKGGRKNQKLGLHKNKTGLFYFWAVTLSSADLESKKEISRNAFFINVMPDTIEGEKWKCWTTSPFLGRFRIQKRSRYYNWSKRQGWWWGWNSYSLYRNWVKGWKEFKHWWIG